MPGTRTSAATVAAALAVLGLGAPAFAEDAAPQSASSASESTPDSAALKQTAEAYLQTRAETVTTASGPRPFQATGAPSVLSAATAPMAARLRSEFAALAQKGQKYKEADGGYTKAEVDVTVTDATTDGDTSTVNIVEDGRLYLPFTQEEVAAGAPEYEEYSLPHTLKFNRAADGKWLLASDKAHTSGGVVPSTQVTEPVVVEEDGGGTPEEDEGEKEGRSTPMSPMVSVTPKAAGARYNYNKMVAYADKHWRNYNDAFRKYSTDCTNFISQVVYAGGWDPKGGALIDRKKNKYWFYGPTTLWTSYTWAGAENWYWFAKKHSKRTKILGSIWHMGIADVLQADFNRDNTIDHTMVVTKLYRGIPYLTYHTSNTHNKSLKKIVADYSGSWWYAHRT
ncbi:amidase domain-containing protein [Streptomyces cavernae]|uniref:amidase domain-containing protein n=1 Tax=Streptomyces cavernae TaxID=2259034 RepID=UPI000FEC15AE|nr:amidase domain-containing protein [Streptomyces cavernae]